MRFRPLLLILPFLFVLGCTAPQQPVVPPWVQQPPVATAEELYGVSVAPTPEAAIVSAAGGIASGVLDAAKPLVTRETGDSQLRSEIVSRMKQVLQSLDYSKIKLKEQSPMEKNTAVLVAMQRSDVIAQLKRALQELSGTLSAAVNPKAGTPDFAKLVCESTIRFAWISARRRRLPLCLR